MIRWVAVSLISHFDIICDMRLIGFAVILVCF